MNDQQAFQREVETWIMAEASTSPPRQTLDDILVATGRQRPLPRWLTLIKEPPMRRSSTVAVGSPMARVAAIMVATLLLALTLAGAGVAGSRLLAAAGPFVVAQDGSGTHTTITHAVAAANDGDTIMVKPGTYVEAVTIDKDISLIGDGPRDEIVIQNPPDGPVADREDPDLVDDSGRPPHFALLVEDADATITGLTVSGPFEGGITAILIGGAPTLEDVSVVLEGPSGAWQYYAALYILGDSRAHVVRSELIGYVGIEGSPTIEGTTIAAQLYVEGAVDFVVRGNTFPPNPRHGYTTVTLDGSTGTFEGNDLMDGALVISEGSDVVVHDNTGGRQGIKVSGEDTTVSITDNIVTPNVTGIEVGPGAEAMIEGNTITGGMAGLILGSDAVRVEGNTITEARTGIIVNGDAAPTLISNAFCDNEQDLRVPEGSPLVLDPSNEVCPA